MWKDKELEFIKQLQKDKAEGSQSLILRLTIQLWQ